MLDTHVDMGLDDDVGSQKKKDGQIRFSLPSFVRFSKTKKKSKICQKIGSNLNLHKRNGGQKNLTIEGIK